MPPLESLHDVDLLALSPAHPPWARAPSSTPASAATTIGRRKLTTNELAARAEANGYKRGEYQEED